jgi:hypothetical protein
MGKSTSVCRACQVAREESKPPLENQKELNTQFCKRLMKFHKLRLLISTDKRSKNGDAEVRALRFDTEYNKSKLKAARSGCCRCFWLLPLFLKDDKRVVGLIYLLVIALRLFCRATQIGRSFP